MKEDFFKQLDAYIEVAPNEKLIDLQAAITFKVRENKRRELEQEFAAQQEKRRDDVRKAERAAERDASAKS